ncbi:MAG: calcium-binding protein, partial [Pseudomonadota bacterium]
GGGIYVTDGGTITNSTIASNVTEGRNADGGGIFSIDPLTLTNVTLYGNEVQGTGSRAGAAFGSTSLHVVSGTVTANAATEGSGRYGGLFADTLTLANSIVSGNFSGADGASDADFNTSRSLDGANLVGAEIISSTGSTVGVALQDVFAETAEKNGLVVGQLSDNGGGVATISLKVDLANPVIDAGVDALAPASGKDARGFERIVDIDGIAGTSAGAIDLGALELSGTAVSTGADTVLGTVAAEFVQALSGEDLAFGGAGDDVLNAGLGNDSVSGGVGNDTLRGQGGNDTVAGDIGDDFVLGGIGIDFLYGGENDDLLFGQGGDDVIVGGDGEDDLRGGSGADLLDGAAGNDTLFGQGNADTLIGGQDDDALYGATGSDLLYGGVGNDSLFGGTGADRLVGEAGDDRINGGANADVFYFSAGMQNDTIVGFEDDIDTIEISLTFAEGVINDAPTPQEALDTFAGQHGTSVVFDFGGGDFLRVVGVTVADLGNDLAWVP